MPNFFSNPVEFCAKMPVHGLVELAIQVFQANIVVVDHC